MEYRQEECKTGIAYNVIAVFDSCCENILMCKRRKNPYIGLYNLVGGKIEPGEDGLCAAYRELDEETGITGCDIALTHLMDFLYCLSDTRVEVYAGRLNKDVRVHGDENELLWLDIGQDFFDTARFAGEGNIGHIVANILFYKESVLGLTE